MGFFKKRELDPQQERDNFLGGGSFMLGLGLGVVFAGVGVFAGVLLAKPPTIGESVFIVATGLECIAAAGSLLAGYAKRSRAAAG